MVDYDPSWPELFAIERDRLDGVFDGTGAVVEHTGSTAVPGLAAKPIIDICVGLEALSVAEERVEAMRAIGHHYVPEYERAMPERRYFRKPASRPRTHHVHCFVLGSSEWDRHIRFRDLLRAHPELVAEYGALKKRLSVLHAGDRPAYTDAKGPFIARVLAGTTAAVRGTA